MSACPTCDCESRLEVKLMRSGLLRLAFLLHGVASRRPHCRRRDALKHDPHDWHETSGWAAEKAAEPLG